VGGYTGNLWNLTWGLNYLVGDNLIIRPELRYDWFSADQGWIDEGNGGPGTMPYGRLNDKNDQFYGGCDVVWQF
jgi:hypothetical protein